MTTPATGPSGGDVPTTSQGPAPYPTDYPAQHVIDSHAVINAYPVHIGAHVTHVEGRQHRGHGHKHKPGE